MKKSYVFLTAVCVTAIILSGCNDASITPVESSNLDNNSLDNNSLESNIMDNSNVPSSVVSGNSTADVSSAISSNSSSSATSKVSSTVSASVNSSTKSNMTSSGSSILQSSNIVSNSSQSTSSELDIFPVIPQMLIWQAAPKVHNVPIKNAPKITSEYTRASEYDPQYAYTHHPGLTIFKGRLYYSYSRGYAYEDTPGQHGVVRSMPLDDFGNWSDPIVAIPARRLADGHESYVIPGYLHVIGDIMYLYYMDKEYGPSAYDANDKFITTKGYHPQPVVRAYYRVVSTTDGVNWSDPADVGFAANESPRRSLTGQWFAGAGNKLLKATREDRTVFSWAHVGMTNNQYQTSLERGALRLLTEASWYQTDDYIIHQMLRSHDGYVWMSESYDNGNSWTEAYPTKLTSDTTMANFGRLPDGRFYAVCNPTYQSNPLRYPLALYISEDGYAFDQPYVIRDESYNSQKFNWTKVGAYAYPEVLIYGDYMYVAHSQYKEVMSLSRIKLSDIR